MIQRRKTKSGEALAKALEELKKDKRLLAGYFQSQMYPEREDRPAVSLATVAREQDEGTPRGVPATHFLSRTAKAKRWDWIDEAKKLSKSVLRGSITYDAMLTRIGLEVQNNVKEAIRAVNSPPLKTATVLARLRRLKGRGIVRRRGEGPSINLTVAKRLHDTGTLLRSVTFKIEENGKST